MPHPFRSLLIAGIAAAALFASCDKDKDANTLPAISFKTSAGYTYKDTSVAAGTTLMTGINANKTESEDVLKVFGITRSLDGGSATGVVNESLSGSQGDNYSTDHTITTRNTAGTEKYVYTISNRDGLVNTVSLTVTTH